MFNRHFMPLVCASKLRDLNFCHLMVTMPTKVFKQRKQGQVS